MSAVDVEGSLTLKNGAWISARKGCSVQGLPGSNININDANVDATDGCGIGLNGSTLIANKLDFFGLNTPSQRPAVGINANNSQVTVTKSQIGDALVGINAQQNSVGTIVNTTFPNVDQPTTAGSDSVVTAPPTLCAAACLPSRPSGTPPVQLQPIDDDVQVPCPSCPTVESTPTPNPCSDNAEGVAPGPIPEPDQGPDPEQPKVVDPGPAGEPDPCTSDVLLPGCGHGTDPQGDPQGNGGTSEGGDPDPTDPQVGVSGGDQEDNTSSSGDEPLPNPAVDRQISDQDAARMATEAFDAITS